MTDVPLDQRFADAMGQALGPDFPSDIGLAVSGGGDSMAMLYLAHNWTRTYGVRLWVATVDHGLRSESASEAAMVAEECAALGWPHATVRWHWDGAGNVQDAARRARIALIDRWRGTVKHVLLAHTQDDQAETVLMRLARGSGVDGLAAMAETRRVHPHPMGAVPLQPHEVEGKVPQGALTSDGYSLVRPCLEMSRAELRHYAQVLNGRWVDDPTNEDRTYERVRVRHLLKLLSEEGITAPVLAETAARMARARDGLNARLVDAVNLLCSDAPLGQVRIERDGFAALDEETQLRLLTSALCYVASSEYRPRAASSEALLAQVLSGGGGTLHGAEVLVEKGHLRVVRELNAVRNTEVAAGTLWDDQWLLELDNGGVPNNVKALGEAGWRQIADRTDLPLPHKAALSMPSLWREDTLLACPSLGFGGPVSTKRYVLGRLDTGFKAFCVSH